MSVMDHHEHIRPDNGPEFIATALGEWLERLGNKTLYIEPSSPWAEADEKRLWESLFLPMGYCQSFKSKLRDEPMSREILNDLPEAKALIEGWGIHYNT